MLASASLCPEARRGASFRTIASIFDGGICPYGDLKQLIRPFHVKVPKDALADLCLRVTATPWPEQETVADRTQGAHLAQLRDLLPY